MNVGCGGSMIGWIIGESSPDRSIVMLHNEGSRLVRSGSYIVSDSMDGCIMGIVERLTAGSRMYPGSVDSPELVRSVWSSLGEEARDYYIRGSIRWLARVEDLEAGRVVAPKHPPLPGTPVYTVDNSILEHAFSPRDRNWIRLGVLEPSGVEYRIDVNRLTRHLAILAVTGGGKSNTVCVLARRLVQGLNASIVLFDMHGEYGDLGLGDKAKLWTPASVNPASLGFQELLKLVRMPPNAINQERILRWAWRAAITLYREGLLRSSEIIDKVYNLVEGLLSNPRPTIPEARSGGVKIPNPPQVSRSEEVKGVLNKLDDMMEYYSDILDDGIPLRLVDVVIPGKLTVFDLSSLDEQGADAVTSHYLRRILQERKKARSGGIGYPTPLIIVLEEAHVLVPAREDRLTKYWAARIAREGRKFGIGLTLVSQRPKNIDPDVLSQTNNKIILRMVEPNDIRYVQAASEELSDDLTSLLPGLNPGEAIVIGSMTRLPALVKIDECRYRRSGGDIDLVREWSIVEEEDIIGEVF